MKESDARKKEVGGWSLVGGAANRWGAGKKRKGGGLDVWSEEEGGRLAFQRASTAWKEKSQGVRNALLSACRGVGCHPARFCLLPRRAIQAGVNGTEGARCVPPSVSRRSLLAGLLAAILMVVSCKREEPTKEGSGKLTAEARKEAGTTADTTLGAKARTATSQPKAKNVVLFLGDSLTAGYNLAAEEAYPALLQATWKRRGGRWEARNAGVSGDTTAGVLRRLSWVLSEDVHTVFLAIGGNDGLRGLKLEHSKKNLESIVDQIHAKGKKVILAGIKIPPNYGPAYTQRFEAMYIEVAKAKGIAFMPFLLEGVAGRRDLNLADGIHPNPQGHQIIAKAVLAFFDSQRLFP